MSEGDVSVQNGATPLLVASEMGHLPVVQALLEMRANVELATPVRCIDKGVTGQPLHCVCLDCGWLDCDWLDFGWLVWLSGGCHAHVRYERERPRRDHTSTGKSVC